MLLVTVTLYLKVVLTPCAICVFISWRITETKASGRLKFFIASDRSSVKSVI